MSFDYRPKLLRERDQNAAQDDSGRRNIIRNSLKIKQEIQFLTNETERTRISEEYNRAFNEIMNTKGTIPEIDLIDTLQTLEEKTRKDINRHHQRGHWGIGFKEIKRRGQRSVKAGPVYVHYGSHSATSSHEYELQIGDILDDIIDTIENKFPADKFPAKADKIAQFRHPVPGNKDVLNHYQLLKKRLENVNPEEVKTDDEFNELFQFTSGGSRKRRQKRTKRNKARKTRAR